MLAFALLLSFLGQRVANACTESVISASGWRVVASTTRSGWAWDVTRLNFVTKDGIVELGDDCSVIHSGSVSDSDRGGVAGYEPENAFSSNRQGWGGRKSAGQFYLGIECATPKAVQSVQILQEGRHIADAVAVERSDGNGWIPTQEAVLYPADTMETIPIVCDASADVTTPGDVLTSAILLNSDGGCSESAAVSALFWRVVASTTRSGWAWDVTRLNFVTKDGIVELGDDCSVIHSGSVSDSDRGGVAGYEPENAFRSNSQGWGGRKSAGQFYLGIECTTPKAVQSVQILQEGRHIADAVAIERSDGNEWITTHEAVLHADGTMESIPIVCAAVAVTTTLADAETMSPFLSNLDDECFHAFSWRVVASTTRSGWAWDVTRLNFVTKDGIVELGDDCSVIHSGSVSDSDRGGVAGYEPENAFSSNNRWWGGRKSAGQFYLGIECATPKAVQSVEILQEGKHIADAVAIERSDGNEWIPAQEVVLHSDGATETIPIVCDAVAATLTAQSNGCLQPVGRSAFSWRVVASTTRSGWAWDVTRLNFVTKDGIVELGDDCSVIHSGSVSDSDHGGVAGYEPENAFRSNSQGWGGRKSAGQFYLGIECTKPKAVLLVQILQEGEHVAENIVLQRLEHNAWVTVYESDLHRFGDVVTLGSSCHGASRLEDIVKGVLKLSLRLVDDTSTFPDAAQLMLTEADFLSESIAELYDLSNVAISSIDAVRRLQGTKNVRLQIQFAGVGAAVADVPASSFQQSFVRKLQTRLEPHGWKVQSASVDFEEVDEGLVAVEAVSHSNMKLYLLAAVLPSVLCCIVMLAVLCIRHRQTKALARNTHEKAPLGNNVVIATVVVPSSNEAVPVNAVIATVVDASTKEANSASVVVGRVVEPVVESNIIMSIP